MLTIQNGAEWAITSHQQWIIRVLGEIIWTSSMPSSVTLYLCTLASLCGFILIWHWARLLSPNSYISHVWLGYRSLHFTRMIMYEKVKTSYGLILSINSSNFLGFLYIYRQFIRNFSLLVASATSLMKYSLWRLPWNGAHIQQTIPWSPALPFKPYPVIWL